MVLSEVECNEVKDAKGSETSVKEMVSLGEGEEKTVGVKIFLAGGCREVCDYG